MLRILKKSIDDIFEFIRVIHHEINYCIVTVLDDLLNEMPRFPISSNKMDAWVVGLPLLASCNVYIKTKRHKLGC